MKPRAALLALLLPLGALINVAVAWAGALFSDLASGKLCELYAELPGGHHWEVYRWDRALGTRVLSRCWLGPAPGPYNHGDPAKLLPRGGRLFPLDTAAPQEQSDVEEGWGFPFRSLSCRAAIRPDGGATKTTTTGAIRLRVPRRAGERGLYLPLVPLWGGFALDALLYGLLSLVLYAAARDLRRALRRRAGRRAAVNLPCQSLGVLPRD